MRFRRGRRYARACARRHARVGCCRTSIEVDGQFCGQLTIGNVTHGALRSAWIGYWVASSATGGGVATAALALGLDHCLRPGQAAPRRGDGAPRERGEPGRAGKGRASARKGCCGATSRWTAPGAITCWWPSPSRNSTARQRPRWCARATRAGPDARLLASETRGGVRRGS